MFKFFDINRQKRIQNEKENYIKSYNGLLAQKARHHIISWLNNFLRLDRIGPYASPVLIGSTIEDCVAFKFAHRYVDNCELSAMLCSLEQKLENKIMSVAYEHGYHDIDVEQAIIYLAKNKKLYTIIGFLKDMDYMVDHMY